jgi:hypothetical protein
VTFAVDGPICCSGFGHLFKRTAVTIIFAKKSCCARIGPQCDVVCTEIILMTGSALAWVDEINYIGVFLVQMRNFKCSFDCAKRSTCRALNAVWQSRSDCFNTSCAWACDYEMFASLALWPRGMCSEQIGQKLIRFTLNRFVVVGIA